MLERIDANRSRKLERRSSIDMWLEQYLIPAVEQFSFGGHTYPFGLNQTYAGQRIQEISATLPGYMAAIRGCPPAFAAQMVRAQVLSGARFTWRNLPSSPTPRRTFGNRDLAPLERPWPNATTGQLISLAEWHAGLAGNAYVARQPGRLRVLRPDWCGLVYGSRREPEDPAHALDGELVGLVYQNGGIGFNRTEPQTLLPGEFAHWSPLPDPECAGIGMSWLTPAVREIQVDRAATEHKLQFFRQGATPNLVVKGIAAPPGEELTKAVFDRLVDMMEDRHAGLANAYRTLYLTAGADATVVGSNLAELDLKNVQGGSETRISVLSRVHPVILAIAEGLAGSSLNAGNFGMARRIWADSWIYPTLEDLAASMAPLVNVPADAELWTDTADMPILREDAKDAAEIEQIKQTTIVGYVKEGFTWDSAVAAVQGQDVKLLKHTGLVSVQLQPPGVTAPTAEPSADGEQPARGASLERYNPYHGKGGKFAPGPGGAGGGGEAPQEIADNAAGRQFIKDNYSGWHKGLTVKEDKALAFYQSPGFELMNGQLRGHAVKASAADLKRARDANRDLAAAIRKAPPLGKATVVHRGFSASQFDLRPGLVITDKGFVSTSLTGEGVTAVAQHGSPAVARITLPKGAKAGAGYTRELILPPGSSFRITGVTKKGKTTQVEMELIG